MTYQSIKTALKAVFLITAILLGSIECSAKEKPYFPDFAYPKTVAGDSEKMLKEALKKHDDVAALRALINLIVAKTQIDRDSSVEMIKRIHDTESQLNAPYSSLAYLLEARLYNDIYSSSSWRFNNRQIPEAEADTLNPYLWDAAMFTKKITGLLAEMLAGKTSAEATPLEAINPIIEPVERIEYYTIYDFIVYNSLPLIRNYAKNNDIIPFYKREKSDLPSTEDLIDQLLTLHSSPSPAQNYAILSKLSFLDNDKADFLWDRITQLGNNPNVVPLVVEYYNLFSSREIMPLKNSKSDGLPNQQTFLDYINSLEKELDNKAGATQLAAIKNCILAENVSLSSTERVQSLREFPVEAVFNNLKEFYVLVVECPDDEKQMYLPFSQIKKYPVAGYKKVECDNEVPFEQKKTVMLSVGKPGRYTLVAASSPSLNDGLVNTENDNFFIVTASDIDIVALDALTQTAENQTGCYVLDSSLGKPVEGADITVVPFNNSNAVIASSSVTTGADGFARIKANHIMVKATYEGSHAETTLNYYPQSRNETKQMRLFTSQAIYHPGDSVKFFGITYFNSPESPALLENEDIRVTLYDANSQRLDTLTLQSDRSGRFFGTLALPKNRLLGNWHITASCKGANGKDRYTNSTSQYFKVEEFKTPSFLVSLSKNEGNKEFIKFEGTAATYSGMPVVQGAVNYTVTYNPFYFWGRGRQRELTYSGTAETDFNGNFTIQLPLDNLEPAEYPGIFFVSATVTNEAGETQQAPATSFRLRDSYVITASLPAQINISDGKLAFPVKVNDPLGVPSIQTVGYSIQSTDKKFEMTGEFQSPLFSIETAGMPSGEYNIKFYLKENELADTCSINTIIFRNTDIYPPVETPLWVENTEITVPRNAGESVIKYGSSFPGQNIICIISDTRGNLEKRLLISDGKLSTLKILAPAPGERVFVNFVTVKDHRQYNSEITLIPEVQREKLEISASSFRDAVTSGDKEHWTFRLTRGDRPVEGYAYALLYDKALDALAPLNWNTTLYYPSYPRQINIHSNWLGEAYYYFSRHSYNRPMAPRRPSFEFDTYGYPLFGGYYGATMFELHAPQTRRSNLAMAKSEAVADNFTAMKSMATEGAVEEETPEFADTAAMADDAGAQTAGEGGFDQTTEVRPIEMPVALFQPDLKTTPDGGFALDFTVPNFNTTWKLMLGAYTPDLMAAGTSMETVASKTVMVKMEAPRFMRTGDRNVLKATVYNNSETDIEATGIYEIFNPSTGEVIKRVESDGLQIVPSGNNVFSVEFTCPSDINAIGLRVYGLSGSTSDGEQTVIPVLPSSEPVIEAYPFYLNPGQKEISLEIPSDNNDANVTFNYCDNPLWEVVTALSPIIIPDSESILLNADAFYANCIGNGIMKNHPEIRKGLEMILKGEAGDSLLISNLEKNQELKTVTLENTPWVNDSRQETLTLSRLSSLINSAKADAAIENLWQKIIIRQNPDGGWSWCPGMQSSPWITRRVLQSLANLTASGYLPEFPTISPVVEAAITYCDKSIVEDYRKFGRKQGDVYLQSLLPYLYIRSSFSGQKSSGEFKKIQSKALKAIEKGWKKFDIEDKAVCALLLWKESNSGTALAILESLREYATEDSNGVYFANLHNFYGSSSMLNTTSIVLDAFNTIRREDPIIDKLKQWLILQKQTQNWAGCGAVSQTINSILTTGTEWNGNYEKPEIIIGGTSVEIDKIAALTGQCKINIDFNNLKDNTIFVSRQSPTQAWGGILRQYIAPALEVKANATPELKINKQYILLKEEEGAIKPLAVDTLKTGDKVRVSLEIICERDMDYVALTDSRPSCLEPAQQLSGYTRIDGLWCYREIRNTATNLFFSFLPKGRHIISYDCYVNESGEFAAGIATLQCLYSPVLTANSAGEKLTVE